MKIRRYIPPKKVAFVLVLVFMLDLPEKGRKHHPYQQIYTHHPENQWGWVLKG